MKKTAFFSDLLFIFFTQTLLFLCVFRALRLSFSLALFLGSLCGLLGAFFAFFPLNRKRQRTVAERKDVEKRDDLMLYLALLERRKCAEFFRDCLAKEENDLPDLRFVDGYYALETKEKLYFPLFTLRPVDGDTAAQIVRTESKKAKTLLCRATAKETDDLLSRFQVDVRKADEIYGEIKAKKRLPQNYPFSFSNEQQKNVRKKATVWFSKKNAKGFLSGGLALLFLSAFTPFAHYYRLFSILLLCAALFVRFWGRK